MYKKIKEIDIEEIKIAISKTVSKRQAIELLNCNTQRVANFHALNFLIVKHKINIEHYDPMYKYNKIPDFIKMSYSLVDVAKNVCLVNDDVSKISARLCKNIKKYINENNLDTSHFRHSSKVGYNVTRTNEEVFAKNSDVSQSTVKKRFIAKVKYECAVCGVASWNNAHLSLQLDHIDGDNQNNLIANLRLLCPNCHSQTENFGSKNKTFKLHKKSNVNDKVDFTSKAVKKDRTKKVKDLFISDKDLFISDKERRQSRADKILKTLKSSSIDFSKHGWATPASKIIGVGHQHVARWMRMYAADFYKEKCFIRKPMVDLVKNWKEDKCKIKKCEFKTILAMKDRGYSINKIAKKYGVHHSSVQKILKTIDTQNK